jgi:membrane-bound serine protease (ClpP class)
MTPIGLAILLFSLGAVLVLVEVMLPTHGVVGVLAALLIVAGVGVTFYINQYLGLGIAVLLVVALPICGALWVKIWPKTPVGRRLILGDVTPPAPTAPAVHVGQTGVTVTELRPTGVCEFPSRARTAAGAPCVGTERLEARCEHGTIPAGRTVRVVAVVDSRPTVRMVEP